MPTTAQEVYNQVVCHLSSGERLRLATIILNQLVGQQQPSLHQSDTWTEENQIDLVNFYLNYAAKTFSDVEGGLIGDVFHSRCGDS
ncbi:MAG: hypothetical protein ACK5UO_14665 [Microcystis sp.]|jgi:hypothetical protein|uniref:hypothetical protein n=1 Tax=Microcystis sp. TaxID=1127 RepID=UPI00391A8AF9